MKIKINAFNKLKQQDRIEYLLRKQQIDKKYGLLYSGIALDVIEKITYFFLLAFIFLIVASMKYNINITNKINNLATYSIFVYAALAASYIILLLIDVVEMKQKRREQKELIEFFKVGLEGITN